MFRTHQTKKKKLCCVLNLSLFPQFPAPVYVTLFAGYNFRANLYHETRALKPQFFRDPVCLTGLIPVTRGTLFLLFLFFESRSGRSSLIARLQVSVRAPSTNWNRGQVAAVINCRFDCWPAETVWDTAGLNWENWVDLLRLWFRIGSKLMGFGDTVHAVRDKLKGEHLFGQFFLFKISETNWRD